MADYTPKGEMKTIGGIECYVNWASVPQSQKAVIVFQDVFGIHSGRHKQFCDMLAEKGYGTVMPDLTGQDPIVKAPQYGSSCSCFWGFLCAFACGSFKKKTAALSWEARLKQITIDGLVPWMKEKGATKLASVGFCWGTYGAMNCGRYPEHFSCNASFHPSTEGFCKNCKEDDLELCRAVRVPQLVVATSMESAKWKPDGDAHKVCNTTGVSVTWLLEEKEKHGFMMRGDTKKPETLAALKKYMDMLINFFGDNMK